MKLRLSLLALLGAASSVLAGGDTSSGKQLDDSIDAAKLWQQTCQRCHNIRPAKTFSDAQWDVIMHHMRVRANLTGPEARAILEFIKDAN